MVVKRADVRSPQARFDHWRLRITAPHGASVGVRREMVLSAVAAWYRERAEEHVRASVERWRHRFGVSAVPPVLIGDQRSFWESCSPGGTLRFSWRTMMLEPALIDYIVVHELIEARDERRLLNLRKKLARLKLLIIDELGFVPLSKTGAELLFEVFSQRYERGSVLVTTNLPFDEWTEVFGSERLTGACWTASLTEFTSWR